MSTVTTEGRVQKRIPRTVRIQDSSRQSQLVDSESESEESGSDEDSEHLESGGETPIESSNTQEDSLESAWTLKVPLRFLYKGESLWDLPKSEDILDTVLPGVSLVDILFVYLQGKSKIFKVDFTGKLTYNNTFKPVESRLPLESLKSLRNNPRFNVTSELVRSEIRNDDAFEESSNDSEDEGELSFDAIQQEIAGSTPRESVTIQESALFELERVIPGLPTVKTYIPEWVKKYNSDLESMKNLRSDIIDLSTIQPVEITGLHKTKKVYQCVPVWINTVSTDSAIDMFVEFTTTNNVPFIRYNDSTGGHYFKVLDKLPWETDIFRDLKDLKTEPNFIYALMHTDPELSTKLEKNRRIELSYDIRNNSLTFELTYQDLQEVLSHIQAAFTNVSLSKIVQSASDIQFRLVKGLSMNTNVFADLITNNSTFSKYLFIREDEKLFYEKNPEIFSVFSKLYSRNYKIYLDTSEIRLFDIPTAHETQAVESLCVLFAAYELEADNIKDIYRESLGVDLPDRVSKDSTVKVQSKLDRLKELSLDFGAAAVREGGNSYPFKCQKNKQPLIVTGREADYPKVNVLTTAIAGADHSFFCDSKDFPYPALIRITESVSLPCCYKTEGLNRKPRTEQGKIKVSDSFLDNNKIGTLPANLGQRLGVSLIRKGVSSQGSSLINCCLAVSERPELSGRTSDYVLSRILKMSVYCMSQENYDKSSRQIHYDLQHGFIDSRYYIRALEILFGLNIFVFDKPDKTLQFEIPRHVVNYIKQPVSGDSIMIYRNRGSNIQKRTDPRYELILPAVSGESITTNRLFELWESTYKTYIVHVDVLYNNYLNRVEYPKLKYIAQKVDMYGKMYALLTEFGMALYFNPGNPLNLPLFRDSVLPTIPAVIKLFGDPAKYVYVKSDVYALRYNDGLYIPVKSVGLTKLSLPTNKTTQKVLIFNDKTNELSKHESLKKLNSTVLFLMSWIKNSFDSSEARGGKDEARGGKGVSKHGFGEYITIDPTVQYNFGILQRQLPQVDFLEKFDYLEKTGFTRNRQIILYSQKYKAALLNYFSRNIFINQNYIPIELYYTQRSWLSHEEVSIFLSRPEKLRMHKELTHSKDPYVLEDMNGYYIIQSVNNKKTAAALSQLWNYYNINFTRVGELVSGEDIPVNVYKFVSGNLELVESPKGHSDYDVVVDSDRWYSKFNLYQG